jgi:hypothetical protein
MEYSNYPLRILTDLYNALKKEAAAQGRSINKQFEAILKERYAHSPPSKSQANTVTNNQRISRK